MIYQIVTQKRFGVWTEMIQSNMIPSLKVHYKSFSKSAFLQ